MPGLVIGAWFVTSRLRSEQDQGSFFVKFDKI